jgi:hypothetical protein
MKKVALLLVVLASAPFASTSTLADGPVLNLKRPRATFMRRRMPNERTTPAVTVRISALLKDLDKAEELEKYYCLDEVWDWDDDTESEYSPDCDPYEPGTELKTQFGASHQYRTPGSFRIRLRLESNGKTVISGTTRAQIRN